MVELTITVVNPHTAVIESDGLLGTATIIHSPTFFKFAGKKTYHALILDCCFLDGLSKIGLSPEINKVISITQCVRIITFFIVYFPSVGIFSKGSV